LVTGSTQDQRLAASGSHDLHPSRFFPSWVFFQVFECSDVVGSGAVVPCGDHPSPALRTVRAACHRTRLALYVLFEILFVRERACMKLVMASPTEDQGFPVAGCHHTLPERLSFCYIFQLADMMPLNWPFRCFTVLTPFPVESFHDFGGAAGPDISVGWYIYRESRYFAVLLRRKNATGSTHRKMENTPIRQARRSLIDPLTLRSV